MKLQSFACALALVSAPALAKEGPKSPAKVSSTDGKGASKTAAADGKGGAHSGGGGGGGAVDPHQQAMTEAWQKYATPGEMHQWLKKTTAGKWAVTTKSWMGPGEPTVSTGSAEVKSVLGDRYVMEEHNGTYMGKPFNGMGFTGYDNAKKKFVSTWVDNMGSGIMNSEGTLSADGKTLNATATQTNPMTGATDTVRVVDHFDSDGKRMTEFFEKGPDGKEAKMMEIHYVRK